MCEEHMKEKEQQSHAPKLPAVEIGTADHPG